MLLCLSSGDLVEMSSVALGEVAVVAQASFDGRDFGCRGSQRGGGLFEGDAVFDAQVSQVLAVGDFGRVDDEPVDFSGYVTFEAAQDLAVGVALGSSACGVGLGSLVAAEPDGRDAPQGVVAPGGRRRG